MICESCIHNSVCKYGEARSNGLYCTGEKCKQYLSSADVLPKSEVEHWKEINEQLYKEMSERILEERNIERKLVARAIFTELFEKASLRFDGFRNTIIFPLNHFDELKKKYTEGDK